MNIFRPSPLNQKQKRVCRSTHSMFVGNMLLVGNIPKRFSWLNCRKQKLVQSKILHQGLFVLISCHFRQVFIHYAILILISLILKSLGNSPSLWVVQKKNRLEKWPFIATNNWTVLAVPWSVKYFFDLNSPTLRKGMEKKTVEKNSKCKEFCFSSKRNKQPPSTIYIIINGKNFEIVFLLCQILSLYILYILYIFYIF